MSLLQTRTPPTLERDQGRPGPPVSRLAVVGGLLVLFEVYVLLRWILGPTFRPTPPGPDPIPPAQMGLLIGLQIAVPIGTVICFWFWIVRPWKRAGRMTTDVMFVIAGAALFFWDMCMNYTSVTLFYNSHLINFGAWANGAWPGWTSPNANLLPEPVLIVVPAYTCLVFSQVMVILWLLRKVKTRWPDTGVLATLAVIVVGLTISDTIVESLVLRTGVYAYPGGIRALTLFAGRTYQMPLTESFFFGGLGLGSIAAMMHFRDDRGHSIAERRIDELAISRRGRQAVRFAAIFGAVHLSFALLYMVPNQWLSTHSDPFPAGYPSYLVNGMCAAGDHHDQCPGPGVPLPRP